MRPGILKPSTPPQTTPHRSQPTRRPLINREILFKQTEPLLSLRIAVHGIGNAADLSHQLLFKQAVQSLAPGYPLFRAGLDGDWIGWKREDQTKLKPGVRV